MKTLFSLFFLFLFSSFLYAQDAELKTLQESLARALKMKNRDSIAASYCHLGEYYAYRQADSARYYNEKGLEFARTDVSEPYIILLNNLADAYNAAGNMDAAIEGFHRALKEARRFDDTQTYIISMLSSVGVAYRRKNMPDSALVYYNKALKMLEGYEAYDERVHLLTSMAVLYANTVRLKEAEHYIRTAVKMSEKCEDMDMVLYAASTAGAIMGLQEKHEEAVQMLYPALAKARQQRKPKFILKSIVYLLNSFSKVNKRDSIDRYMNEAEKIVAGLPETSAEVLGYWETSAEVLAKMGRYRESLDIHRKLLRMSDSHNQTPVDRLFLRMARNHMSLKEYRHAADCYEKAYGLADSLHRTEVDAELSELSMKYENQEKALEIARLNQEQLEQKAKTMQWTAVAIVAIFAFLLLAFYYMFRQKRIRKEEELKLAQSYIEGLERERTRLAKELHDGVCNDLLGIGLQMQCMPPTSGAKQELQILLEQVRDDVRYISHELMPPKFQSVTLAETIEWYMERLAIPSSMQLGFSKESDNADWRQVPEQVAYEVYRILQEVLSNILKHSGATRVSVNLLLNKELLTLLITNNGKSFSDAGVGAGGIGLTTIQERVKATGGVLFTNIREGMQMFKLDIPLSL